MPNAEKIDEGRLDDAVAAAIEETNDARPPEAQLTADDSTVLFGEGGLDSIGLVNFVVAAETHLEDQFGRNIVLADEKAMSRRNSPFRSVGALKEYVREILSDGQTGNATA